MAKGVKPRIKVPKQASAGESITIKTLISHKMETGLRKDADGKTIPQSIINRFTCDFNGSNVVDFDMEAGISVNPYFQFEAVVPESGECASPNLATRIGVPGHQDVKTIRCK